jgi:hypothetical protein
MAERRRRFLGELRLPGATCLVLAETRTQARTGDVRPVGLP